MSHGQTDLEPLAQVASFTIFVFFAKLMGEELVDY